MLSRRSLFSTAALLGTGLTALGSAPARAAATVPASALDEVVPTKAAPILLNFNMNPAGFPRIHAGEECGDPRALEISSVKFHP